MLYWKYCSPFCTWIQFQACRKRLLSLSLMSHANCPAHWTVGWMAKLRFRLAVAYGTILKVVIFLDQATARTLVSLWFRGAAWQDPLMLQLSLHTHDLTDDQFVAASENLQGGKPWLRELHLTTSTQAVMLCLPHHDPTGSIQYIPNKSSLKANNHTTYSTQTKLETPNFRTKNSASTTLSIHTLWTIH